MEQYLLLVFLWIGAHLACGVRQDEMINDADSHDLKRKGELEVPEGSTLTWQNVSVDVKKMKHTLSNDDLHREFFLIGAQNFSKYIATSEMCGAGLFTKAALNCEEMKRNDIQKYRAMVAPVTKPRGFGVELEMLARPSSLGSTSLEGVKRCYKKKLHAHLASGRTCNQISDCPLGEYCRKPHKAYFSSHPKNYCKSLNKCTREKSVDGECTVPPMKWKWTRDVTVKRLTNWQAKEAGAEDITSETTGVGFELISPVLDGTLGLTSLADTLGVLEDLGIQAGPSQGMHVHVNVGKATHENGIVGSTLNAEQIHNVWVHYARFQYVIDEMLQDSRIGNNWAKPLIFQQQDKIFPLCDPKEHCIDSTLAGRSTNSVLQIFKNLQEYVRDHGKERNSGHCDAILKDVVKFVDPLMFLVGPCSARYPRERYFQLNLATLNRLGTIEFRAFPATNDPVRAFEWVSFILQFVEHYKDDGRFLPKQNVGFDPKPLMHAQHVASLLDLEHELNIDLQYWRKRPWLQNSKACKTSAGASKGESKADDDTDRLQEMMANGDYQPVELNDEDDVE